MKVRKGVVWEPPPVPFRLPQPKWAGPRLSFSGSVPMSIWKDNRNFLHSRCWSGGQLLQTSPGAPPTTPTKSPMCGPEVLLLVSLGQPWKLLVCWLLARALSIWTETKDWLSPHDQSDEIALEKSVTGSFSDFFIRCSLPLSPFCLSQLHF